MRTTSMWLLCLLSSAFGPRALWSQPANDNFADRAVLIGTNLTITCRNVGASKETWEPNYVPGGASVWWSWTAPEDCVCVLRTFGSTFDTVLGVFRGNAMANLIPLDINDDAPTGGTTSELEFDATAGTTYQIYVDGYEGAEGDIRLQLTVRAPILGRPAPAWSLRTPAGATLSSTSFAGKVVILDFWATWCGPCKVEIPDFVALQSQYGGDGLAIIGVSLDTTSAEVTQFVQTHSPAINYTIVMGNSAIQTAYGGINAIPTTFIVDRNNIIRRKFVGSQSKSEFSQSILPLLYGRLDCCPDNGLWTLRWRSDGSPVLEHTATLYPPAWGRWTQPPQQAGGTNILQIPGNGTGFFRLRYAY